MCGIGGIFAIDDHAPTKDELERIKQLIIHRGPDDQQHCIHKKIGLVHTRLSIIDIDNGQQPMYDHSRKFAIVYNGEIYNYQELRAELDGKFKTNSDTEVILQGFIQQGTNFFKKLNGMFSFAIVHIPKQEVWLCRDRMGIKPLYMYQTEKNILFASEIKAFYGTERFTPQPNKNAIKEYLTFSNIHSNNSFFQNVTMVQPGTWKHITKSYVHTKEYWSSNYAKKARKQQDVISSYQEKVNVSVKRHMISEVPLGTYLSGGIDSSSVASLASKAYEQKINVFTGEFPEKGKYSELKAAQAVSEKISAKHHVISITPDLFEDSIKDIAYHMDEPKVGMGAFPQYHVSKEVSKHVTVVLTGHGGDELFAGYPVFKARILKSFLKNPKSALNALLHMKLSEIPRIMYYMIYPFIQKEVGYGIFVLFSKRQQKQLLTKKFQNQTDKHDSFSYIKSLISKKQISADDRIQEIYLKTYLPSLFIVEDKVGMAHSIEARTPLCDNALLAFSQTVPLAQKVHRGELKSIPRTAMRKILPETLFSQPKKGFPTPLSLWFRTELKEYVSQTILSEKMQSRNIFNIKSVKRLLDAHFASKTDTLPDYVRAARIWAIMQVELWYQIFIDDEQKIRSLKYS